MISLAGREGDWAAFDSLNRVRFGAQSVPAVHRMVLALRGGDRAALALGDTLAAREDRELFHAADDVALFLHDLPAAERLLRPGTAPARGAAFRDTSYRRLAIVHAGQGRWSEAASDLARLGEPGGLLTRALLASMPFMPATDAELTRLREDLARWSPADEPPPSASEAEAALAAHLRIWLLGLVELRRGSLAEAARAADALERMRLPSATAAVVPSMVRTLRAGIASRRGDPAESLRLLEPVRGNVPAALVRVAFYAEEPARYLRAEALQRLGRDAEALAWLQRGFDDSPAEVAYLAPRYWREGQIYEGLGETEKAVAAYGAFVELWGRCDPALRPQIQDAKARLARLLAEPRSR
jgi:tetratricopeptide (TPR) repeat protein